MWQEVDSDTIAGLGRKKASKHAIYIPFDAVDGSALHIGDIVSKGRLGAPGTAQSYKELMSSRETAVILSIEKKNYGSVFIRHWKIGGE